MVKFMNSNQSCLLFHLANWYVDEAKNMPLCGNSSGAG